MPNREFVHHSIEIAEHTISTQYRQRAVFPAVISRATQVTALTALPFGPLTRATTSNSRRDRPA
jgi:hypothetical protein